MRLEDQAGGSCPAWLTINADGAFEEGAAAAGQGRGCRHRLSALCRSARWPAVSGCRWPRLRGLTVAGSQPAWQQNFALFCFLITLSMDTGFFKAVSGFKFTSRKHRVSDDDAVDRINSYYAPVLIVIMSSIVMTKMYLLGDPPAWEQYAETYCWLKNTYFVPPNGSIPGDETVRQGEELKYYQWVPFVLAIQALMFHLPAVIWKLMNWQFRGPDQDAGRHGGELRGMTVRRSARTRSRSWPGTFERHREEDPKAVRLLLQSEEGVLIRYLLIGRAAYGRYLINVYIVIKLLYIANVVGQFFLLNGFLGTDYGLLWARRPARPVEQSRGMWQQATQDLQWCQPAPATVTPTATLVTQLRLFPLPATLVALLRLLSLCRRLLSLCLRLLSLHCDSCHSGGDSCHSTATLIFVFLWFMLLFVAVVTILDALFWLAWAFLPNRRFAPCAACWSPRSLPGDAPQMLNLRTFDLEQFFNDYIDSDGAFLLRMIGKKCWRTSAQGAAAAAPSDCKSVAAAVAAVRGGGGGGGGGAGIQEQPTWPQRLSACSPVHLGGSNSGGSGGGGSGCGVGGGAASSAPWPVLVARMRPAYDPAAASGPHQQRALIRVGHAAPLQSQLLADLGVCSRGFALARRRR
uniref:Innexin n=1 Tax=Macrostomum lignano TaxID=282301 RepID=A0A1I8FTE8_9PLAT